MQNHFNHWPNSIHAHTFTIFTFSRADLLNRKEINYFFISFSNSFKGCTKNKWLFPVNKIKDLFNKESISAIRQILITSKMKLADMLGTKCFSLLCQMKKKKKNLAHLVMARLSVYVWEAIRNIFLKLSHFFVAFYLH